MQKNTPMSTLRVSGSQQALVLRYVINGVCATAIHFGLLYFNLKILGMPSAGLANLFAAAGGITASFFGCRYFVFPPSVEPIMSQASKFGLLYLLIACLHGAVVYAWTDVMHHDYRVGFLIATAMQMTLSFLGNKFLVFSRP